MAIKFPKMAKVIPDMAKCFPDLKKLINAKLIFLPRVRRIYFL